eukprot:TRINITY_DN40006_c0_g1_i1.p1 TRINITY_DN40006_c0_g1~~TRINITY_DN40006_c0_g1_i1.p1  ORF type:complete len:301 (+),score=41.50 TRINITY_DN40006_c0_g1_i1:35-937(+)
MQFAQSSPLLRKDGAQGHDPSMGFWSIRSMDSIGDMSLMSVPSCESFPGFAEDVNPAGHLASASARQTQFGTGLPERFSATVGQLHRALGDVEDAAKLLLKHTIELGLDPSPLVQHYVDEVAILKKGLLQDVVPQAVAQVNKANNTSSPARVRASIGCEPSTTAANDVHKDGLSSSGRAEARNLDMAARAGSFHHGLSKVTQHTKTSDIQRTVVVQDIGKLGPDVPGELRRCFARYGKVELAIEPRMPCETALALVRMENAAVIEKIMVDVLAGKLELPISPLTQFVAGVSCPQKHGHMP